MCIFTTAPSPVLQNNNTNPVTIFTHGAYYIIIGNNKKNDGEAVSG